MAWLRVSIPPLAPQGPVSLNEQGGTGPTNIRGRKYDGESSANGALEPNGHA